MLKDLTARMRLDTKPFAAGLKSVQDQMRMQGERLRAIGTRMSLAISVPISAAVTAAVKSQLTFADEMSKSAAKFGVPIETLTRLKYAADLSDVSTEALGTNLGKLNKAMVEAAKGGAAAKRFKELGVEVQDASGKLRSADQVLADLSDRFASMPDGAEKTALAMQLFGKSGAEMIPMLNMGAEEMRRLGIEAETLGLVIDAKTGKAAEAFNDNLTRLKSGLSGMAMQITAALAPALERLSEFMVGVAKSFNDLSPQVKTAIGWFLGVTVAAGPLVLALGVIAGSIGIVTAGLGVLKIAVLTSPLVLFATALGAIAYVIYDNWTFLKTEFLKMLDEMAAAAGRAKAAILDALSIGREEMNSGTGYGGMGGAMDDPAAMFGGAGGGSQSTGAAVAIGLSQGVIDGLAARRQAMRDSFAQVVTDANTVYGVQSPSKVFRQIGKFISEGLSLGLTDGVPQVKTAMAGVNAAVATDEMTAGLYKFRDSARDVFGEVALRGASLGDVLRNRLGRWASNAASNLFTSGFNQLWGGLGLPAFANGVNNFAGGLARINERGGEVVRLPGGSTVYPHDLSKRMADRAGGVVEIVVRQEPGVTAEIARNEAGAVVRGAAPAIVGRAVDTVSKMSNASKRPLGIR